MEEKLKKIDGHILKEKDINIMRSTTSEKAQDPALVKQRTLAGKPLPPSFTVEDHQIVDIRRAILKAEADINMTNDWRLHECILIQMRALVNCMPSEFIYTYFVPVIFNRILLARPVPCRLAAVKTLLIFLRYNNQQAQKQSMRSQIDTDLRRAHSCYTRKLYVKLCDMAMDVFSRRYFKDYFFLNLLELCDDPVPNIRLMVVALMPKMKAMVLSGGEHKLLNQLESCVRKLNCKETDRDVKGQLHQALKLMTNLDSSAQDPALVKQRTLAGKPLPPSFTVETNNGDPYLIHKLVFHYGVPVQLFNPSRKTTTVKPFSFEERDKAAQERKQEKLQKMREEAEKQCTTFHARPIPAYIKQNQI